MDDIALLDSASADAPAATNAPPTDGNENGTTAGDGSEAPAIEIDYPEEDEGNETGAADAGATDDANALQTAATTATDASPLLAKFGTGALTKILAETPGLKEAADASPHVRAKLYQMARRSQELGELQEVVPTVARAREAVEAQQALSNMEAAYRGEKPEEFWNALYQAQLAPGADGQMRSSGAYERNVQFLHRVFLDRLEASASRSNNETVTSAVKTLREALGWSGAGPARSPAATGASPRNQQVDETNLPPHIRQRLEQAEQNERELEQLRTRRSEEARQGTERFLDETAAEVATELRTFVDGLLAQARLSDYDKQNIARDFIEAVSTLADQDKVQSAALDEIMRSGGATPQTRARMVARAKAWARQNGREILEPILQRAGAGLKQRQAQRAAAAARREPATQGAAASPARPSARDLLSQAEKKAGRRLSDREILELA